MVLGLGFHTRSLEELHEKLRSCCDGGERELEVWVRDPHLTIGGFGPGREESQTGCSVKAQILSVKVWMLGLCATPMMAS
jgi:hypothetical protein